MDQYFSRELGRRWLLTAGCFLLLLFFFSPPWAAFELWSRVPEAQGMLEVRRGAATLEQLAHPGAPVSDSLHAVIQWRVLIPAVAHLLALPSPVFFGLAHFGSFLALGYLVTLLRRRGATWRESALSTLVLGSASWFFTSTGWLGYWDSWLALGLLVVGFGDSRWTLWAAFLWAPWVDERFVLAAPLALLCRMADRTAVTPAREPDFSWRREVGGPAALVALFLLVRFGLLAGISSAGATPGGYFAGRHFLDAPLARLALGVWEGLRAGWFFVGAAVALLAARRIRQVPAGPALGAAVALLAALGLATAQDYSRSMTMVLPAAVLGAIAWHRSLYAWRHYALGVAAGAALLLPAHHVMNDRVNPIYYIYHELAAFATPAPGAMPELYELRAIHEMERGEYDPAEKDLTFALALAKNPASPARQRGILRASRGRWAEALADFTTALQADPANPDAWFMRAQANFATGHAPEAHSDMGKALALAPAGWTDRPDVRRFLAKLGRP